MGLFGFVGKALGKVAKAGLSVATKGLSDKVFSALKGSGKKPTATKPTVTPNIQNQALMAKLGAPVLKLSQTEAAGGDYVRAAATKKRKKPKKAKAPKASSGAKRAAPKGGLDLKKIGQMYQAAGKPMPWLDFVKANSNVRKG